MTPRAAISPAWLGLFALGSFGGLVLASFASGYHLVVKGAEPGAAAPGSGDAPAAISAPAVREAITRQGLTPDLALVRSEPEKGEIVARLPGNQSVRVLAQEGPWARIEFARDGKSVAGWTLASNLSMR